MTTIGSYFLIMCIVAIVLFAGTLAYQSFRYKDK